jgi:hypothetical protein
MEKPPILRGISDEKIKEIVEETGLKMPEPETNQGAAMFVSGYRVEKQCQTISSMTQP